MVMTVGQYIGQCRTKALVQQQQELGVESILGSALATGKVAAGAVSTVSKVSQQYSEQSLSEYTKTANVEPRVMLEESLRNLPSLEKFFLTLTNIYTAYYLQAVALSAEINGVSVISRLERFNPNRNGSTATSSILSNESLLDNGFVLPNYKKNNITAVSMRPTKLSNKLATESPAIESTNSNNSAPPQNQIVSGLKAIQDMDNLAVGRLVEVSLTINGKQFKVPIAVRVRPMAVPSLIMRELVALGDIRESWRERWHRMRSGELSIVSDWIFQSDRIRKRRKLMALDKQGLYKEMLDRRRNNKIAAAKTGNASIGSASSFIIITKETAKEVERRSGMPIENEEFRKRIFGENSAFMIIVIDRDWERLDVYTRGISGVATYSFKQFETMSKGNGPDIGQLMKAYTLGNGAQF